jgi:hypothetical protein
MSDVIIDALVESLAALAAGVEEIEIDEVVADVISGLMSEDSEAFVGGELSDVGKEAIRESVRKYTNTHTTEQIHDLARKTRRAAEQLHKKLENTKLSEEEKEKIRKEEKILKRIAKQLEENEKEKQKLERKRLKKERKEHEKKLESIKHLSDLSSEEIENRMQKILDRSPGAAPIFFNRTDYLDLELALPIAKERERLQSIESEKQRARTIELQLARTAAWEKLQREQAAETLRRQAHEEAVAAAQSQYGSSLAEDAARARQQLGLPPKRVPLGQGLSNAAMLRMSPILESLPSPAPSLTEERGSASPGPQRMSPLLAPLSRASPVMEEERGSASPFNLLDAVSGPPRLAPLNLAGSRSTSGGRSFSGGSAAAGGGGRGGGLSPFDRLTTHVDSAPSPIAYGQTAGNLRAKAFADAHGRGYNIVSKTKQ